MHLKNNEKLLKQKRNKKVKENKIKVAFEEVYHFGPAKWSNAFNLIRSSPEESLLKISENFIGCKTFNDAFLGII